MIDNSYLHMMTEISSKYLKQNQSYITFSEDTHLFWRFKDNAAKSSKNTILLSLISNNCYQIGFDNVRWSLFLLFKKEQGASVAARHWEVT